MTSAAPSQTPRPALSIRGVSKTYPGADAPALDDVSMTLRKGEVLAVLGPSGSGKSTLLRAIAGLDTIDSGTVEPGSPEDRIAVVFQSAGLFPWLSVRENIALGGRYRANRERFDPAEVDRLLEVLGLQHLAGAAVTELSGGQAQRVAIARVLAAEPRVILLDEPLSALDVTARPRMRKVLQRVLAGRTAMIVTHDPQDVAELADHVVRLERAGNRDPAPHTTAD